MKENIIYKILQQPNTAIFDLLRNTVYGTKGVKIMHRDTDKKLKELHQPDFHTLWENNELLAVAVYCKRNVGIKNTHINSYYIRYFSVSPKHQGKGLGKLLTKNIEKHYKQEIDKKTIFYAYIEDQNLQSSGVSKHFKMHNIGKFTTVFFSRFFPKKDKHCAKATAQDLEQVQELLEKQYKNHCTTFFNRIGYENAYYIHKEGNEIIAGIQAIETNWSMTQIPGVIGWLTLNVFPYTPIFNRIANGKKFHFIGFEGVYYHPNKIDALLTLIEHALADKKIHKGFLYFDSREKIISQLKESKKLGLLNKIQKSPQVSISNQSLQFLDSEQEILNDNLKYISAYDIT